MSLSTGRFLALFAALILALTGGTVDLEHGSSGPVIVVCSEHGTYEMPLDLGDPQDSAVELCCGDCAVAEAVLVSVAGALASPPRMVRERFERPADRAGFVRWAWHAPPMRGPPSFA
ncbi:DUF2946 family protein [Parvularcula lutaonensis]|uniref:DUF2946 family protein n=1 Tax=Parvularcula lutaonensis TaxID=491923 RepID=A0ABV7MAF1_9PROT|nr:DUF2946 family protein [Parvularcula lutaonensis]GGY45870.1 hypothetical protein GCM10007148_13650 [Parvularcula lutaonensis]